MIDIMLVVTGLAAGILSGVVGVGGGIVIVPALVLFFGLSQKHAQGTTLAMLALPVGILAAATYFKAGYVEVKVTLWLALGFVVGALLGAHYAVKMPEHLMSRVFGGVLLAIALKLLILGR
ncbi:MAG TPA: sulfite exporter TauE/SafE family protein [Patescibacteria group bacterium]|nr:sulfite exporter TauE/SafE family protein [Patescibacteria group bacterium]